MLTLSRARKPFFRLFNIFSMTVLVINMSMFGVFFVAPEQAAATPSEKTESGTWPDCGFQCKANDTTAMNMRLVDVNGDDIVSCEPGVSISAKIMATITNNTNSPRKAAVLIGDIYQGSSLLKHLETDSVEGICALEIIDKNSTIEAEIYSFMWTCGEPLTIDNMTLSWGAGNDTCESFFSNPMCSERNTKCYSDLTGYKVLTPVVANFAYQDVCYGNETQFTDKSSGGEGNYSYYWDFGDGNSSTGQNPSHTYLSSGIYNVSLTVDDGTTSDSQSYSVAVHAIPTADFTANPTAGDAPFLVSFSDNSTYPAPLSAINWDFGDSWGSSDLQNPYYTYNNKGDYTITLTATDVNGCSDIIIKENYISVTELVITYSWFEGGWGECSVECGGGTQDRIVECRDDSGLKVADENCTGVKPTVIQSCNSLACPTYEWVPSEWGACSADCGGGTQTREVVCQDNNQIEVDESLCTEIKPDVTQICNSQSCLTYNWSTTGWSTCDANCGGGAQTRSVVCRDSEQVIVSDEHCGDDKPEASQICNSQACPVYGWVTGDWMGCSAVCGGGTQARAVVCEDDSRNVVDDTLCTEDKPNTDQICNTQACPTYSWFTGDWGVCSEECDGGTQVRTVECRDENRQTVDESNCTESKPNTEGECNTQACSNGETGCGNGSLDEESGEECDDGNTSPNDGCSATCQIENMIEGCVYNDENDNGVYDDDGSEGGIRVGGFELFLERNVDGVFTQYATGNTDEIVESPTYGCYTFEGLPDGEYRLYQNLAAKAGWKQTFPKKPSYQIIGEDGDCVEDEEEEETEQTLSFLSFFIKTANAQAVNQFNFANKFIGGGGGGGPVCGNGTVEAGETCDDGNNISGDGCSAVCTLQGGSPTFLTFTNQGALAPVPSAPSAPVEEPEPIVLGEEGEAVLAITKTVDRTSANQGDKDVVFMISVSNSGNMTAFGVTLLDALPEGLVYADDSTRSKVIDLGDLDPGASKTAELKVDVERAAEPDTYTSLAEANAENAESVSANASLDVRAVAVLAVSGFDRKEFAGLLAALSFTVGAAFIMKRKIEFEPVSA